MQLELNYFKKIQRSTNNYNLNTKSTSLNMAIIEINVLSKKSLENLAASSPHLGFTTSEVHFKYVCVALKIFKIN